MLSAQPQPPLHHTGGKQVNELEQTRQTLSETMNFLSAIGAGVEKLVGPASKGMAFMAGKKLARNFSENTAKTDDIFTALDEVHSILENNNCLWSFETFKPKMQQDMITTTDDGTRELLLVFKDCMIRQSLFRFGHEQKGTLCYMMYGFFAGALENIMGCRSELQILHAGENACLKKLKIFKG